MTQWRPERSGSCPKTKIENRHHWVLARHEPLMNQIVNYYFVEVSVLGEYSNDSVINENWNMSKK